MTLKLKNRLPNNFIVLMTLSKQESNFYFNVISISNVHKKSFVYPKTKNNCNR
jgi:hypothetical protein